MARKGHSGYQAGHDAGGSTRNNRIVAGDGGPRPGPNVVEPASGPRNRDGYSARAASPTARSVPPQGPTSRLTGQIRAAAGVQPAFRHNGPSLRLEQTDAAAGI